MTLKRTTARRWARGAALAAAAGIAVSIVPSAQQVAHAAPDAPAPTTAAQAAQLVAQAGKDLEATGEQVNEARTAAEQQQAAAALAASAAQTAQAQLTALEPQLTAIAQSGYTGNARGRLAVLLTSTSADDLVQQLSTLEVLADHADDVVGEVVAARDAAEQAQSEAAAAAATAAAALADATTRQAELEARLASYRADFGRLSVPDQARVTTTLTGPELPAPSTAAVTAAAPTEAGAAAIRAALGELGSPYVHGASGPSAYDCSGLTMFAYAAAGISLPHSSRAQFGVGTAVARADLQPGDLVFFYSPISHVGLYIGNGQMVHASVPGRPVAVTGVDKLGYAGARRVTG